MIEEFLRGEEASFFALVDGETCVGLLSSQVHGLNLPGGYACLGGLSCNIKCSRDRAWHPSAECGAAACPGNCQAKGLWT